MQLPNKFALDVKPKTSQFPLTSKRCSQSIALNLIFNSKYLKRVRTWFVNEAKRPARDQDEQPEENTGGIKSGNYNRCTACAQLFKEQLNAIIEEQAADRDEEDNGADENRTDKKRRINNYQAALTTLWKSLSAKDKQKCKDAANEWNKAKSPADVQRK
jgi:hypothetical protein